MLQGAGNIGGVKWENNGEDGSMDGGAWLMYNVE